MIYIKAIAHTRNTKKSAANLTTLSIPQIQVLSNSRYDVAVGNNTH
ncbi:MAG: hypothetical protein V7L05_34240 [Nostoc sp.]